MIQVEILQMSVDELMQMIRSAVREELSKMETSSNNTELLNVDEAAAFLNIPSSTIYQLSSKREIPRNKRGRRLYFLKSDLLQWIKEGKLKTNAEIKDDVLPQKKRLPLWKDEAVIKRMMKEAIIENDERLLKKQAKDENSSQNN